MRLRSAILRGNMMSLESIGNVYVIRSGRETLAGPIGDEGTALRRFAHLIEKGN